MPLWVGEVWTCSCGTVNHCEVWTCSCGTVNAVLRGLCRWRKKKREARREREAHRE